MSTIKLETVFVAIFLGSLIFLGLFTVMFDVADKYTDVDQNLTFYDVNNNTISFQDTYDKINSTKKEVDETYSTFNKTTLSDESNSIFPFLSLGFKIGKDAINSLNLVKTVFMDTSELLGIDPRIIITFFSLLLIILLIVLVLLLLGRSY